MLYPTLISYFSLRLVLQTSRHLFLFFFLQLLLSVREKKEDIELLGALFPNLVYVLLSLSLSLSRPKFTQASTKPLPRVFLRFASLQPRGNPSNSKQYRLQVAIDLALDNTSTLHIYCCPPIVKIVSVLLPVNLVGLHTHTHTHTSGCRLLIYRRVFVLYEGEEIVFEVVYSFQDISFSVSSLVICFLPQILPGFDTI